MKTTERKFKNIEIKNEEISFIFNGKKYTRKAKKKNTNLYSFQFKNNTYYIFEYFDGWGKDYTQPFTLNKDYQFFGWPGLYEEFDLLKEDYENYEKSDTSVPAAPDTSKFISVRKGNLEVREKYVKRRNTWSTPDYYPFIFIIGREIYHDLPEEFWNRLYSILAYGILNGLKIDDKIVRFGAVHGTAWSGFGLMN